MEAEGRISIEHQLVFSAYFIALPPVCTSQIIVMFYFTILFFHLCTSYIRLYYTTFLILPVYTVLKIHSNYSKKHFSLPVFFSCLPEYNQTTLHQTTQVGLFL